MPEESRTGRIVLAVAGSMGWLCFPIILIFVIAAALMGGSSSGGAGGYVVGQAVVSSQVEFYRPYLEREAARYHGMEKLVDLMLALIQQEAGGEPWIGTMDGDIMQSSESAGYPGPGYLKGEASIAQGVRYLYEAWTATGLIHDPYNLELTKISLQNYNFGQGFYSWFQGQGYTAWSFDIAVEFAKIGASQMGWSMYRSNPVLIQYAGPINYGDQRYPEHVLQYYMVSGGASGVAVGEVSNPEAKEQLNTLSQNWGRNITDGRRNLILTGASLIGKVAYSMDNRQDDGRDNPTILDCSSFVAWAFYKSGHVDVPTASSTGTFLGAANFKRIDEAELLPGDVGLINMVASGGANHIGIYVGTDAGGQRMWLHCTSHASSGCNTVTNGPRISYYPAFSLFYRYTGF
ncbi:lysozyme family protein [Blautia producta]|uniref:lysozyme family protein n=1 Tax=Blautia producta TaxID=33035 RepID=UPI003984403C